MEQFLWEASSALNADALWDAIVRYFSRLGIDGIAYVHYPPRRATEAEIGWVRMRGFPSGWVARYIEGELFRDDPVRALAKVYPTPFKWSEVGVLRRLTEREEVFQELASTYFSDDSVAIPVFGPGGRNGCFGIFLREGITDFRPEMMLEFQLVSQYAHQRFCAVLSAPKKHAGAALSQREREVLRWVARGKSNSVIADIIGVTTNTVDTHLRRIYKKLDVSDRVSAVLVGLGLEFALTE